MKGIYLKDCQSPLRETLPVRKTLDTRLSTPESFIPSAV